MTNEYYNDSGAPQYLSRGSSATVDTEYASVRAGFDKVPTLSQIYGGAANYIADTGVVNAAVAVLSANLPALYDGFEVVLKMAATNTGAATLAVTGASAFGAKSIFRYDGSALQAGDLVIGSYASFRYNTTTGAFQMVQQVSTSPTSGLPTSGGTMTGQLRFAKGAAVVAAATVNLDTATGNDFHMTGNTTITAFTIAAGQLLKVVVDGTPLITYNATTLKVPGAANIQAAAGDTFWIMGDGGGNSIITDYTRATGWATAVTSTRRAITGASTVGVADISGTVDATSGTFSLAFAASTTLGNGANGIVQNSGSGNVTLTPNGAETIDGLASYVMFPGEARRWYVDAAAIKTQVLASFFMKVTATATFTKPPGYGAFGVRLWSSGASGQRTNNGASAASGGGGGGCGDTIIPAAAVGTTETITIGAGGLAVSGVANGNPGNSSSFGALFTVYPGPTWVDGGSVRNGLTAGGPIGFEGAQSLNTPSISGAIWGGGAASNIGSAASNGSIYGAGAGGSVDAGGTVYASGTSLIAGAGGAASAAANGTAGTAPGGGGGGTKTGANSGAGARGEAWVWGIA